MSKNMFPKILICVDGSKHSNSALKHAITLAKSFHSKLFLVNVIDEHLIDFWNETEFAVGAGKPQVHLKNSSNIHLQSEKLLNKSCRKIPSELKFSSKILVGDISNEIINFVNKNKIDLVILGARGMGKFKKLLLGSISSKISDHSPCSVLIIK